MRTPRVPAFPAALLLLGTLALGGCDRLPKPQLQDAAAPAATPAAAPTATPARYTPPSAEVLYQMVAPIALYPDSLVAQTLAAATYPDQVTAAQLWIGQNPALKGQALSDAANQQPWDPSVKALTAFPNVLQQLTANLPWTQALGQAYYNDPSDVMNAIQALRARAQQVGTLQSSRHLRVVTQAHGTVAAPAMASDAAPVVYSGPAVVPPPSSTILIEPAEVSTVYVPAYNPEVVYGTPVPLYPRYRPPIVLPGVVMAPVVGVVAPAAPPPLLTFGLGVVVGALAVQPHWGWNAWGMYWGAPAPVVPVGWGAAPPPPPPPAVVYRGDTYVSRSTTVVQNIRNVHNTEVTVNNYGPAAAPATTPALLPAMAGAGHAPAVPLAAAVGAVGVAGGAALLAQHHLAPAMPAPALQRPVVAGAPVSAQGLLQPQPGGVHKLSGTTLLRPPSKMNAALPGAAPVAPFHAQPQPQPQPAPGPLQAAHAPVPQPVPTLAHAVQHPLGAPAPLPQPVHAAPAALPHEMPRAMPLEVPRAQPHEMPREMPREMPHPAVQMAPRPAPPPAPAPMVRPAPAPHMEPHRPEPVRVPPHAAPAPHGAAPARQHPPHG